MESRGALVSLGPSFTSRTPLKYLSFYAKHHSLSFSVKNVGEDALTTFSKIAKTMDSSSTVLFVLTHPRAVIADVDVSVSDLFKATKHSIIIGTDFWCFLLSCPRARDVLRNLSQGMNEETAFSLYDEEIVTRQTSFDFLVTRIPEVAAVEDDDEDEESIKSRISEAIRSERTFIRRCLARSSIPIRTQAKVMDIHEDDKDRIFVPQKHRVRKAEAETERVERGLVAATAGEATVYGFTSGPNDVSQLSLQQFELMMGYIHSGEGEIPDVLPDKDTADLNGDPPAGATLPTYFDSRVTYSGCEPPILNQGVCGCCWAYSTASTLSWAACVNANRGKNTATGNTLVGAGQASPSVIMCQTGNACDGNKIPEAWKIVRKVDELNVITCDPPQFNSGFTEPYCDSQKQDAGCPKVDLPASMDIGALAAPYNYNKFNTNLIQANRVRIKQAILSYGAVTCGMLVRQSFQAYAGGVWKPTGEDDEIVGKHAVTVIGWNDTGVEDTSYWIMQNSWGPDWGENGYFRLAFLSSSNLSLFDAGSGEGAITVETTAYGPATSKLTVGEELRPWAWALIGIGIALILAVIITVSVVVTRNKKRAKKEAASEESKTANPSAPSAPLSGGGSSKKKKTTKCVDDGKNYGTLLPDPYSLHR